jgi:hypothetical protein
MSLYENKGSLCSRDVGHKFTISEANVHHWKNDLASKFSCKATTKSLILIGSKKGRHPDVSAALEMCATGMPITRQAMKVKATESDKSLFNRGRG